MDSAISLLIAIGVVMGAFGFAVTIVYGCLYNELYTLVAVLVSLVLLLWWVFYLIS